MRLKFTALTAIILTFIILLNSCGLIVIDDGNEDLSSDDIRTSETAETDEIKFESETNISVETTKALKPVVIPDSKAIAQKYLDALTKRDFDGVGISIITTDAPTFVPSDTKSLIYNARIERNKFVEKKYNTIFMATESDSKSIFEGTKAAVLSGDYYADLLGIPMSSIGQYHASELLMNMNSLPFVDFTAPYYDKKAVNQLTAGYGTYGTVGELNKNIDYYYGVYFNKDLIEKLGLKSPYELVYSNEWTWEKFREYCIAAIGESGVYGYGSSLELDNFIDMGYSTIGENFMDTGIGKIPDPTYYTSRAVEMIEILRNLIRNDKVVFGGNKYTGEGTLDEFYSGNMLFYIDRLYVMNWFTDMKADWGIIPFPKLDKNQKFITYCDQSMPIVSVPLGNANVDYTGLFLQAANAASYGYINDVYYTVLLTNVIRDSDTLNMLDYITGKNGNGAISCDFALMFGSGYKYIADITYSAVRNAVKRDYSIENVFTNYYKGTRQKLQTDFAMQSGQNVK